MILANKVWWQTLAAFVRRLLCQVLPDTILTIFPGALTQPGFPTITGDYLAESLTQLLRTWESKQKLNSDPSKQIGIPRCLSFIWTGRDFATSSTSPVWGSLAGIEFPINGRATKLHEWFREQRQSRFSLAERLSINKYVYRLQKLYKYKQRLIFLNYPEKLCSFDIAVRQYFQSLYQGATNNLNAVNT